MKNTKKNSKKKYSIFMVNIASIYQCSREKAGQRSLGHMQFHARLLLTITSPCDFFPLFFVSNFFFCMLLSLCSCRSGSKNTWSSKVGLAGEHLGACEGGGGGALELASLHGDANSNCLESLQPTSQPPQAPGKTLTSLQEVWS